MWSIGCVLYELIKFSNITKKSATEAAKELSQRKLALFPGDHCFPLTPNKKESESQGTQDQINCILKVKGPINDDDLSFI